MTINSKYTRKIVIGRTETIHFMEMPVADVPAKVDTGAYRSSVHASNIKLSKKDGTLSFDLLGDHPVFSQAAERITTSNFSISRVKNSSGEVEERYQVKLRVKVGTKIFWADFTLADRSRMLYPILLGRTLLNGRFVVDPSQTAVDRLALKKEYGIEIPDDQEDSEEL